MINVNADSMRLLGSLRNKCDKMKQNAQLYIELDHFTEKYATKGWGLAYMEFEMILMGSYVGCRLIVL